MDDIKRIRAKRAILAERHYQRGEGVPYEEMDDADNVISDDAAEEWAEEMGLALEGGDSGSIDIDAIMDSPDYLPGDVAVAIACML